MTNFGVYLSSKSKILKRSEIPVNLKNVDGVSFNIWGCRQPPTTPKFRLYHHIIIIPSFLDESAKDAEEETTVALLATNGSN